MTIQITIIGLGQIGASIGLAIGAHGEKMFRLGHDRDPSVARQAQKMGAVDKVSYNLPSSVEKADVVVLALPINEVYEVLPSIAQDLKDGVVVLDTSPVRRPLCDWVSTVLSEKKHYVGFTPAINALFLHNAENGVEAADAELFKRGMFAITAPEGTDAAAVKLAADLADIVGAVTLFADLVEVDSYMASSHLTPQLLASAMVNITIDKPGWEEARKYAGKGYAQITNAILNIDPPLGISEAVVANKDNVIRIVDELIHELQQMREDIDEERTEKLQDRLEQARRLRETWWKQRQSADWSVPITPSIDVTSGGMLKRMLGFRDKKIPSRDKEEED
jgi:prephenate dehydrogenase